MSNRVKATLRYWLIGLSFGCVCFFILTNWDCVSKSQACSDEARAFVKTQTLFASSLSLIVEMRGGERAAQQGQDQKKK